ncbi:MAG: DUF4013 domain-containing protein [Myxococcota bacterium]|jgi:hypothetical protein|nr:DUF4013 domain-containing protein [Myxococcota bacterium]
MNLGRSLSFAFKAQDAAPKLLVGGLLTLLFPTVFFGFVVAGYVVRVLCNALEGRDAALPQWKDLRTLFSEGVSPLMVVLAYHLPFFLLLTVKAAILSPDNAMHLDLSFYIAGPALAAIGGFLAPAAVLRLIVIRQPKAAFDLPRIVSFIRENAVRYTSAWALSLLFYAISVFCAGVLLVGVYLGIFMGHVIYVVFAAAVLVIFVGFFIAHVISAHLYAQMYRASKPFSDDLEGEARASIALPPPLFPKNRP